MITLHLPCPFCGHRDIRSHHRGDPLSGEWVIECHGCPCELTGFDSETAAWRRWNMREVAQVISGPTERERIEMCGPDTVRNEELGL